ncbi:hypothetical protein G7Y79_00025g057260 [Physcia stellaris]|nr:hypothetical protein G7Y79_00025g057260 [Physcia stellaris]
MAPLIRLQSRVTVIPSPWSLQATTLTISTSLAMAPPDAIVVVEVTKPVLGLRVPAEVPSVVWVFERGVESFFLSLRGAVGEGTAKKGGRVGKRKRDRELTVVVVVVVVVVVLTEKLSGVVADADSEEADGEGADDEEADVEDADGVEAVGEDAGREVRKIVVVVVVLTEKLSGLVVDANGEEADGEEADDGEADVKDADGENADGENADEVDADWVEAGGEDAGREVIKVVVVVVLTEKLPWVVADVDGEVTDVVLAKVVGSVDEGTKVKNELVDVPVELGTSVEVEGWTDEDGTGVVGTGEGIGLDGATDELDTGL